MAIREGSFLHLRPPAARTFGLSDIGNVRKENQDCLLIQRPDDEETLALKGLLAVLADGMGGLEGGRVASELAVQTVCDRYYDVRSDPRTALEAAVKEANAAIFEKAHEGGMPRQMGSTITALVLLYDRAIIAQVGDSRAWRYRHGNIQQLTRDHSLVRELLERGEIEPDSAQYAFHRNILTRGLGLREEVVVDTYELLGVEPGDTYLLSSDGLHELITPQEMIVTLEQHDTDIEGAAAAMVDVAKERGGPDNITIAVVRAEEDAGATTGGEAPLGGPLPRAEDVPRRAAWVFLGAVLLSFVLGVLLGLWLVDATSVSSGRNAERVRQLEKVLGALEDDRIGQFQQLQNAAKLREILEGLRVIDPQPASEPEAE